MHRIPRPGDERRIGVGDSPRVMGFEDRFGRRQARTDRLGATTESGEKVGLDEIGDDPHIRLDVVALETDWYAVDFTDGEVVITVGVVVDDGVAGHDLGPDQIPHLRRGGPTMGTGGAEQGDAIIVEQWWQHRPVGHGSGQIGKDDDDPPGSVGQLGQRRARVRMPQCLSHRRGLVGQPRQFPGQYHRGVVWHLYRTTGVPIGDGDLHDSPNAPDRRRHGATTRWRPGRRWRRARPGDADAGRGRRRPDRG